MYCASLELWKHTHVERWTMTSRLKGRPGRGAAEQLSFVGCGQSGSGGLVRPHESGLVTPAEIAGRRAVKLQFSHCHTRQQQQCSHSACKVSQDERYLMSECPAQCPAVWSGVVVTEYLLSAAPTQYAGRRPRYVTAPGPPPSACSAPSCRTVSPAGGGRSHCTPPASRVFRDRRQDQHHKSCGWSSDDQGES